MKTVSIVIALSAFAGSAMAQSTSAPGTPVTANPVLTTLSGALTPSTTPVLGPEALFTTINASYTRGTNPLATGTVSGLNAGAAFRVRTAADTASGGPATFDTRLRIRDGATVLGNNDDGPSGVSPFSQVTGTVPASGTISYDASWWQNSAYSPTYSAAGPTTATPYLIQVFSQPILTPSILGNRVQIWDVSFTPGTQFSAWTSLVAGSGVTDTIMGFFDSAGNLLASNDDRGTSSLPAAGGTLFSAIADFTAPVDGIVRIAVANYNGFGSASSTASYVNTTAFNTTATSGTGIGGFNLNILIPTPGAAALLGLGGLMAARRRRA